MFKKILVTVGLMLSLSCNAAIVRFDGGVATTSGTGSVQGYTFDWQVIGGGGGEVDAVSNSHFISYHAPETDSYTIRLNVWNMQGVPEGYGARASINEIRFASLNRFDGGNAFTVSLHDLVLNRDGVNDALQWDSNYTTAGTGIQTSCVVFSPLGGCAISESSYTYSSINAYDGHEVRLTSAPFETVIGEYTSIDITVLDVVGGDRLYLDLDVELYELPVSQVPIPAAAWLFGSALVGLVGLKRKK